MKDQHEVSDSQLAKGWKLSGLEVCDDPDKFEKKCCTFEIEVLQITGEEGKVQ